MTDDRLATRTGRNAGGSPVFPSAGTSARGSASARIDRLPKVALPLGGLVALAMGYFFAFYDINVVGTVLPTVVTKLHISASQTGIPITANLIAYMVGAFFLGTAADRIGRRPALAIAVSVLAVASLATGLSWNLASLTVFRTITGLAMGAQIALLGTFVTELAPAARRGRLLATSIVWAAVGQALSPIVGIWLLPATDAAWRLLFGFAVLSAGMLLLLNDRALPESPRWLETRGNRDRADRIVTAMENRLTSQGIELGEISGETEHETSEPLPIIDLFRRPLVWRLLAVFAFWFCLYFSIYGFNAYEETLFDAMHLGSTSGVTLAAFGSAGGIIAALIQPMLIERMQRKTNAALCIGVMILGFVIVAVATNVVVLVIGTFLISAGIFATIIPAYSYTAEIFPTRARASAMGIGDGIGHLGGALQPFMIVPVLAAVGARPVLWILAGVLAVAVVIISFGVRTTGKTLVEIAD